MLSSAQRSHQCRIRSRKGPIHENWWTLKSSGSRLPSSDEGDQKSLTISTSNVVFLGSFRIWFQRQTLRGTFSDLFDDLPISQTIWVMKVVSRLKTQPMTGSCRMVTGSCCTTHVDPTEIYGQLYSMIIPRVYTFKSSTVHVYCLSEVPTDSKRP